MTEIVTSLSSGTSLAIAPFASERENIIYHRWRLPQSSLKSEVGLKCSTDRKTLNAFAFPEGSLPTIYGHGHLLLTLQAENAEPYQGIVALTGNHLAEALESYFSLSEQLPTRLLTRSFPEENISLFDAETADDDPASRH
ncbi:MAG: Hsp33 family molecular chaperone HslO [Gammaproteobacteria bacterium]